MFDKNRLTRPLQGESTFRIFHELLDSGNISLLQELNLDSWVKDDDENLFFDLAQEVSAPFLFCKCRSRMDMMCSILPTSLG